MKNDYYVVDPEKKNEEQFPGDVYHFGIQWKPDVIAGYEKSTGFIVQHVEIEAPNYLTGFKNRDYYEAWLVENGEITFPKYEGTEDDVFAYDPFGFEDFLFYKDSLSIDSEVAWVDVNSLDYEEVSKWRQGAIGLARDLKSSQSFDNFQEYKKFKRDTYVFRFDFLDRNNIKTALIKRGKNIYSSYRESEILTFKNNYQDLFEKNQLTELWKDIISYLENKYLNK